nr:putative transcription elongation factor SPT5 homolog 1 [Tanacetum cinerariifolium]
FIVHERDEQEEVEDARMIHHRPRLITHDDQTEVEQQDLLPSIRDPKLWMVKCAIGHEREVAVCLMQKCITKPAEMQIRSAIALDHLKNYIYIEAYYNTPCFWVIDVINKFAMYLLYFTRLL